MTVLLLFLAGVALQAQSVRINPDLEVLKISDKVYLYLSWSTIGEWGRVGSNGLIVVDRGRAFLIDTPMEESQTAELAGWIKRNLKVRLTGFVPGHWHDDCVGGLAYLNRQGVKTYAGQRTNEILKSKGLPQAKADLADSAVLRVGDTELHCYYLGGGHSADNLVVWLPAEKILFGGCLLKDTSATGLGNTADAVSTDEWYKTVVRVDEKFPQAEIIVPGHGKTGGREILSHTKKLLEQ